jgi:hypothetical protein
MKKPSENPIFLHLDLSTFKTEPCTIRNPHQVKKCIYYHFFSEKRRPLFGNNYSKIICKNKKSCKNQNCPFSHNFIEQIYHPDNYKKKYCKDFIEKQSCKYGRFCAYAHSDYELKINPLHLLPVNRNFLLFLFKSEYCPFSKIDHDRFKCVYAHNWQDFKRPFKRSFVPINCHNWNTDKEIIIYEDGCPLGHECNYCHGWKEYEYHYKIFKKAKCKNEHCERKEICSFKHNDRDVSDNGQNESDFFYPIIKNQRLNNMKFQDYLIMIECKLPKKMKPKKENPLSFTEMSEMEKNTKFSENTNRFIDLNMYKGTQIKSSVIKNDNNEQALPIKKTSAVSDHNVLQRFREEASSIKKKKEKKQKTIKKESNNMFEALNPEYNKNEDFDQSDNAEDMEDYKKEIHQFENDDYNDDNDF